VRLARELESELKTPVPIRWGGFGQLDVLVDGAVVFSKKALGRVPAPGEVAQLVRVRR
jgi:Rdx family protein